MVSQLGRPGPRPAEPAQMRLSGIKGPGAERRRRFSTLTLRILAPNVLALGVLVGGIFYLDRYRDGLLDAKIAAMQSQAEVIAGALGESALTGPEDRRRLERGTAARIIRRLVVPTGNRARLYLPDGGLLMDGVVMRLGAERFFYVQADGEFLPWLAALGVEMEVTVRDPDSWVLQVQGPRSLDVLGAARAGGGIAVVEQVNRRLAAAGLAKVVARVESGSPASARAVVELRLAVEPLAQVPIVRSLEKQAVAASITGREAPLARRLIESAAVVRKIKHRDFSGVKRCATGLDIFAGDDAQVAGAEAQHRVGAVVGGQPNVVGRVAVARGVALDVRALDEKRRLPRAKVVGLQRAGLEVVNQPVGGDDAILVLQRDVALGENFAGGLVEASSVGDDEGTFALLLERDAETVVQDDQPLVEVVVELARLERLDLPHRLVR